jgi:hypothetical protein
MKMCPKIQMMNIKKNHRKDCEEIIAERQRVQLLNAQLNCKFSLQVGQTIALPKALKKHM